MAQTYTPHQQRIRQHLLAAGVTKAALYKPQIRKLYQTIHPDERIEAAVYSSLGSGTAILIATDRRVIYVERRAFSYVFDEFTYDIVSGVALRKQGLFYTLVLHTPINNFTIRTTNRAAAEGIVTCMEIRRIEHLVPPVTVSTIPHTT
jgi:hypothetical protein